MSALTEAIEKANNPKGEDWFVGVKQGNQGGISSLADAVKFLQEKMRNPEKQGSQSWTDTWTVPYEEDQYSFSPEDAQDEVNNALFGAARTVFGGNSIPQSEENNEDNQENQLNPLQNLLQFNPSALTQMPFTFQEDNQELDNAAASGDWFTNIPEIKKATEFGKFVGDSINDITHINDWKGNPLEALKDDHLIERPTEDVPEDEINNAQEILKANFPDSEFVLNGAYEGGTSWVDSTGNYPLIMNVRSDAELTTNDTSKPEDNTPFIPTDGYKPEEHGFEQITDPNSIAMPSGMDLDKMSEKERAEWQESTIKGLIGTALIGAAALGGPVAGATLLGNAGAFGLGSYALSHLISGLGTNGLFGEGAKDIFQTADLKKYFTENNIPNEPLYEQGYTIEDNPYGFKTETQKMQFDKFFKNNDDFVKEHGWDKFGDDWNQRYTTFRVEAEPEDWQLAAQSIPGWRERFEEAGVNVDDINDVKRWYDESVVDIDSISKFDENSLINSASYADSAADLYDYMAYRNMGYPIYNSSGQLTVTPESNREAYGQAKIFLDEDFSLDPVELNYLFRNATKDPIEYGTGDEYAAVDDYPTTLEDMFIMNNGMVDTTSGAYGINPKKAAGLINKRTEGKVKVKQKSKDKK